MTAVRLHEPAPLVDVTVDGQLLRLPGGEPVATAMACAGLLLLRRSPRAGGARGAFCFMGACQECAILIDGQLQQACMVPVRPGMAITLAGAP